MSETTNIKTADLEALKQNLIDYDQANEQLTERIAKLQQLSHEEGVAKRKMITAVRAIRSEIMNTKGEIDMGKVMGLITGGGMDKLQVNFKELQEAVDYYEKNTLTVIG